LQFALNRSTSNDQDCLSYKQNESLVLKAALVVLAGVHTSGGLRSRHEPGKGIT